MSTTIITTITTMSTANIAISATAVITFLVMILSFRCQTRARNEFIMQILFPFFRGGEKRKKN